ncbi:MAG TPA: tetratricopeptide repeat protein, partial [Vicinamibacterales bacterium]
AIAANNLAWIYLAEGRLDDSLYYARVAEEELPHAAQVDDTLGWVYYTRDRPLDAIRLLSAAAGADPNNATYRYHLGAAYAKANQPAAARRELDRALSSPSFSDRDDAVRMRDDLASK